jgi:hypothetical protein
MTKKEPKGRRPKLSAALRRNILIETSACFVDDERLGKADVGTLKQLLAAGDQLDPEISRKRALSALARSDRSLESGQILASVLNDRKASPRDRMAAAAYLGLLPAEASEELLLSALAKAQGHLRLQVIQSLGQIGSARSLTRLRRLKLEDGDVANRARVMAELAIGFRERRRDTSAEDLAKKLELSWRAVKAKQLDANALKEIVGNVGGPRYGIGLRRDLGFRLDCGGLSNAVLLNEALRPGTLVDDAGESNMIAALVVTQAERKLTYFTVRWLVLTSPHRDGIAIVVLKANGDPAFEGTAVRDGKGLRFSLRNTGIERTQAEITGQATDDDVKFAVRVWRGALRDKQRPVSLVAGQALEQIQAAITQAAGRGGHHG